MSWIVEHGFLIYSLSCIAAFGVAVWLWAETLGVLRRTEERLFAVTQRLDDLVARPTGSVSVGVRPGSSILRGVAVDRLPGAPPAGGTAGHDGWGTR